MELQKRNMKRDLEILFLRKNKGWTYPRIGEKYDISRGRVRQLYIRMVKERINVNKELGIGA